MLSSTAYYAPPVVVVQSGGTVTWTSNDLPNPIHHTSTSVDRCFSTAYTGASPGHATFRLVDGALRASGDGGVEKPCPQATMLPDGSALLEYVCLYHAQMRGFVLVNP